MTLWIVHRYSPSLVFSILCDLRAWRVPSLVSCRHVLLRKYLHHTHTHTLSLYLFLLLPVPNDDIQTADSNPPDKPCLLLTNQPANGDRNFESNPFFLLLTSSSKIFLFHALDGSSTGTSQPHEHLTLLSLSFFLSFFGKHRCVVEASAPVPRSEEKEKACKKCGF